MKVFVIQNHAGRSQHECDTEYEKIRERLESLGHDVYHQSWLHADGCRKATEELGEQPELSALSDALESMTWTEAVYLCPGWESDKASRWEKVLAEAYGMKVLNDADLSV